jgi:hypothetical protein
MSCVRIAASLTVGKKTSYAEVLDVREELRVPLVRFRGATVALERTIESVAGCSGVAGYR